MSYSLHYRNELIFDKIGEISNVKRITMTLSIQHKITPIHMKKFPLTILGLKVGLAANSSFLQFHQEKFKKAFDMELKHFLLKIQIDEFCLASSVNIRLLPMWSTDSVEQPMKC